MVERKQGETYKGTNTVCSWRVAPVLKYGRNFLRSSVHPSQPPDHNQKVQWNRYLNLPTFFFRLWLTIFMHSKECKPQVYIIDWVEDTSSKMMQKKKEMNTIKKKNHLPFAIIFGALLPVGAGFARAACGPGWWDSFGWTEGTSLDDAGEVSGWKSKDYAYEVVPYVIQHQCNNGIFP